MLRIYRPPVALAVFPLLLVVAAIAGPSASAAGPSARCGVAKDGSGASEALNGTAGHDLIKGAGGRDLIKGRGGGDCLRGGTGADTVGGGAGRDKLDGGPGRDRLVASDGKRDVVRCGGGKDHARVDAKDKVRGCERTRRDADDGNHGGGNSGGGNPVTGAGYPSLADVDWEGDFDSGCQLVGSLPGAWDNNATNADYTGSCDDDRAQCRGRGPVRREVRQPRLEPHDPRGACALRQRHRSRVHRTRCWCECPPARRSPRAPTSRRR